MSLDETLAREMKRTFDQAEEFTRCGLPFAPWLVKKVKGVTLMETDFESGLSLFEDGMKDESEALEAVYLSRFGHDIRDDDDGLMEAEFHG